MAKVVLKRADIVINGVNLSNHAVSIEMHDEAEAVEMTGFQSDYREYEPGLKDATMTITFISNYAAGSVDATLFPLYSAGTSFVVVAKATDAAVSVTNPSYTMTGKLYSYSPLQGGVGDRAETPVEIRNNSQTGIVKATS